METDIGTAPAAGRHGRFAIGRSRIGIDEVCGESRRGEDRRGEGCGEDRQGGRSSSHGLVTPYNTGALYGDAGGYSRLRTAQRPTPLGACHPGTTGSLPSLLTTSSTNP